MTHTKSYITVTKECPDECAIPQYIPVPGQNGIGIPGAPGIPGQDGISPTVTQLENGVSITDANGNTVFVYNGEQGETGEFGLNPKGSYDPVRNYVLRDLVEFQGSSYTPRFNSPTTAPFIGNPEWFLVVARGQQGEAGLPGVAESYSGKAIKLSNQDILPNAPTLIEFNDVSLMDISFSNDDGVTKVFDPVLSLTKFNVIQIGTHLVLGQFKITNITDGKITIKARLNGDNNKIVGQIEKDVDNTSSLESTPVDECIINLVGAFYALSTNDYIEFIVEHNNTQNININAGSDSYGLLGRWTSQGEPGAPGIDGRDGGEVKQIIVQAFGTNPMVTSPPIYFKEEYIVASVLTKNIDSYIIYNYDTFAPILLPGTIPPMTYIYVEAVLTSGFNNGNIYLSI